MNVPIKFNYGLILSLFLNLILIWVVLNQHNKHANAKVFVGSQSDIECLEKWKKITYDKKSIWGPDLFENQFAVFAYSVDESFSFQVEMSSCFRSAETSIYDYANLELITDNFRQEGYRNISIYKSMDNDVIRIYAKDRD